MEASLASFIVAEVVVALLIVTGNVIVCYVILTTPELQKKVMYTFILSLSISDLLVATIAIPCSIFTKLGLPHNQQLLCISMLTFIMIPTQISIFSMSAIAIERFIAIRLPVYYVTWLSTKRAKYMTCVIWLLSTLVGIMPLFGWNKLHIVRENKTDSVIECQFMETMSFDYMTFNFFVCVVPPILTTVTLYSIIFSKLHHINSPAIKRNASSPSVTWWRCCLPSAAAAKAAVDSPPPPLPAPSSSSPSNQRHASSDVTDITSYAKSDELANGAAVVGKENAGNGVEIDKLNQNNCNGRSNVLAPRLILSGEDEKSKKIEPTCDKKPPATKDNSNVRLSKPKTSGRHRHDHQEEDRMRRRRKEINSARVLSLIVLSFVICWIPIHICNMIFKYGRGIAIPESVIDAAVVTSHSSSVFNFILYSWRLKSFQKALRRKLPPMLAPTVAAPANSLS